MSETLKYISRFIIKSKILNFIWAFVFQNHTLITLFRTESGRFNKDIIITFKKQKL